MMEVSAVSQTLIATRKIKIWILIIYYGYKNLGLKLLDKFLHKNREIVTE